MFFLINNETFTIIDPSINSSTLFTIALLYTVNWEWNTYQVRYCHGHMRHPRNWNHQNKITRDPFFLRRLGGLWQRPRGVRWIGYFDIYVAKVSFFMSSLPPQLCRHWPIYDDVTTPSTVSFTMSSLPPQLCHLLCRHYPLNCVVTDPFTMSSLPPQLCRHWPIYYVVTIPSTLSSLTPCHYPLNCVVTDPVTMTSLLPQLCRHYPLYYNVTTPSTMPLIPSLLWRHQPL